RLRQNTLRDSNAVERVTEMNHHQIRRRADERHEAAPPGRGSRPASRFPLPASRFALRRREARGRAAEFQRRGFDHPIELARLDSPSIYSKYLVQRIPP